MFEELKEKKILLVDDNIEICQMIKMYADKLEIEVKTLSNSLKVMEELEGTEYDIIILDVSMPDMNGFDLFKRIKKNYNIPILFLSARVHKSDKIKGLLLGAEDYVTKPFNLEELFLKVQIILDRISSYYYEKDNLCFDLVRQRFYYNGEEVKLTQKAFLLLLYLVKSKKDIVTRKELLREVWGIEEFLDARTVDSHIKEIRKKVDKDIIYTKRGEGYRYESYKKRNT